MSIQNEIARISNNVQSTLGIIADTGVEVGDNSDGLPAAAAALANEKAPINHSHSYEDLSNKPTIPTKLSELTEDASHRIVTDDEKNTWSSKSNFSGSYNDLSDKPTIPSAYSHPSTHPASMIAAGTFAGQVVANSSGQAPGTSLIRNIKLVAEEATPTVNGEIFFVYG